MSGWQDYIAYYLDWTTCAKHEYSLLLPEWRVPLPSVIGGLVDKPVIAVPTSVGYGAAFDGVAALLGMLTSCASGVSVVNIGQRLWCRFSGEYHQSFVG